MDPCLGAGAAAATLFAMTQCRNFVDHTLQLAMQVLLVCYRAACSVITLLVPVQPYIEEMCAHIW